jgi:hypothetical protein
MEIKTDVSSGLEMQLFGNTKLLTFLKQLGHKFMKYMQLFGYTKLLTYFHAIVISIFVPKQCSCECLR